MIRTRIDSPAAHPRAFAAWLAGAAALVFAIAAQPVQAARIALVIGNADYSVGALRNPVNDARAMDAKLRALNFTVTRVENLKRAQIGRLVAGFAQTVRPGDDVVFFYAGHGVQVKGMNYLPAVDADIQTEEDVALNSLNLNSLLDRLDEAKAGIKLLFLDACRNNPYARSFRSGERGLARVTAGASGTLMHFATRPGSVAADGSGANGLYTAQLLRYMDQPGLPVESMLKRVTAAVEAESKGQQEPWTEGSIRGEFFFRPAGAGQTVVAEPEPVRPAPAVVPAPAPVRLPAASDEPDAKSVEAVVNQKFREWSAGWFMDRYIPGSVRVERKECTAQGCQVAGVFSFVRNGSRKSIPFAAALSGSGSDLAIQKLCYQDNTSGMQDCTE